MSPTKRRVLVFFLSVLIVVLFFFLRGDYSITLDLKTNNAITVDGPQGMLCSIPYEDVDTVALLDTFNHGECIDGGSKQGYTYGTWRCDTYGEYTLISVTKVDKFIAVTNKSGQTLVFNFESSKVTENLYDLILSLLG